jgi:hypothetical protein
VRCPPIPINVHIVFNEAAICDQLPNFLDSIWRLSLARARNVVRVRPASRQNRV